MLEITTESKRITFFSPVFANSELYTGKSSNAEDILPPDKKIEIQKHAKENTIKLNF